MVKKLKSKLSKLILLVLVGIVCKHNAQAKYFGFGVTGHWGANIWGFEGTKFGVDKKKADGTSQKVNLESHLYSGNSIGGGVYVEYFLGEQGNESYGIGVACKFNRRDIVTFFDIDLEATSKTYYSNIYDRVEQDCIDVDLIFIKPCVRGEWVTFGVHFGIGGYYAFSKYASPHDIEPTALQKKQAEEGLNSFNIYGLFGLDFVFLDKMMEFRINASVTFLNQLNKDSEKNGKTNFFTKEYGKEVSIGQFQISPACEFRLNLWEIITG